MSTSRLQSFSDGVFAVAITILVFDLLPIGADAENASSLKYALLHGWPQYAAYAVSFLTIGIMWINHHTLIAHLRCVDRRVLLINLLLLVGVVALPFPTALVATALTPHHSAGAQSVATVAYGLVMVEISVGFAALWLYLLAHQASLVRGGVLQNEPFVRLRFTGGLFGYVAGLLIAAFWSAVAALILYALLAVYYIFENLPAPSGDVIDDDAGDGITG
jgi:uncharacterized membrane protein